MLHWEFPVLLELLFVVSVAECSDLLGLNEAEPAEDNTWTKTEIYQLWCSDREEMDQMWIHWNLAVIDKNQTLLLQILGQHWAP